MLTKDKIRSFSGERNYLRGVTYYNQGRVHDFCCHTHNGSIQAECFVHGSEDYFVELLVHDSQIEVMCDCPLCESTGKCKHIVAALLTFLDEINSSDSFKNKKQKTNKNSSDSNAKSLLQMYQDTTLRHQNIDTSKKARLVPRILPDYNNNHPFFSFQVGFDKLYVVKDIAQFLKDVSQGKTVSYGKNLTLCHHLSQFDTFSQALIRHLMDQLPEFRSLSYHSYYPYYQNASIHSKNRIQFTGSAFDRWFDLFLEQSIENQNDRNAIYFLEKDPQIIVSLDPHEQHTTLQIQPEQPIQLFGWEYNLYALSHTQLLRCSPEFREHVAPLLNFQNKAIQLSNIDLPSFCASVLPKIEDQVTLHTPEGFLSQYTPMECTPCFYFDLQHEMLLSKLLFRYEETDISPSQAFTDTPEIRRNLPIETSALQLLEHYIPHKKGELFVLEDDDAIFTFITEHLKQFHAHGEVYISQSLRAKRIPSKGAQVGISVSDGLLSLQIDTGEFPPEELDALYYSLLQKRTYHRLSDGRYLELNGSPYEALAETVHTLQLSPDQLKQGKITMPTFRAPYLDQVLSGQESFTIQRDQNYRALLRQFKAVAESEYTPPESLTPILRSYQSYGFQWLKTLEANHFGGILADEMGLGKTVQMIAFLSDVCRAEPGRLNLVVCPASLLLNWADECAKFAPELQVELIMGNAAERKQRMEQGQSHDLWITSYDLLKRDIEYYENYSFYCVILDEGQNIKNQSTQASKSVKRLNCQQRFVLTGTPIENRLSELWNLFDFLMPGYLFNHSTFVSKLEKPIVQSKNQDAARRLSLMIQPFLLRRNKQDVLKELPPKIEHIRRIPLSAVERKHYLAFANHAKQELEAGEQGKLQILAAMTRLRQLCCDPNLCIEGYSGETSKLDACIELCASMAANKHQILVFSQFTTMLERIQARLDAQNITNFTLRGSTPKETRAKLVKAFQAGEASVFLISLKAGGTGLNLTAADVVIHFDPWWNLAAQNQATDRAHRIGQQTHVQVYKLIAQDTIEEKILTLQQRKAALMDVISTDPELDIGTLSTQELLELFT